MHRQRRGEPTRPGGGIQFPVFFPEYRTMDTNEMRNGTEHGSRLHTHSMHRQPKLPDAMNTNTRLPRVEERAKFEQRLQRDANVMIRHIVYDKDSASELHGRSMIGMPPHSPTY